MSEYLLVCLESEVLRHECVLQKSENGEEWVHTVHIHGMATKVRDLPILTMT